MMGPVFLIFLVFDLELRRLPVESGLLLLLLRLRRRLRALPLLPLLALLFLLVLMLVLLVPLVRRLAARSSFLPPPIRSSEASRDTEREREALDTHLLRLPFLPPLVALFFLSARLLLPPLAWPLVASIIDPIPFTVTNVGVVFAQLCVDHVSDTTSRVPDHASPSVCCCRHGS